MLLVGALVASLALVPAFISMQVGKATLQKKQNDLSEAAREDQAKQTRTLALLSVLTPLTAATSSPSALLSFALGLKPNGISITSVAYTKKEIVLSGVSNNRLAVNDFRDALQNSGRFASVAIPVSALVGAQEGRFTVTLTGAF